MTDKVVLVTGAAKRIGAGITRRFHQEGFNVIVHYHHSETEAMNLTSELNQNRSGSAKLLQLNLGATDQLSSFGEQIVDAYGQIDILVNNASAFFPTPLDSLEDTDLSQLLDTNLKAPLLLSKLLAPGLRETSGCIINIVDVHAEVPLANYSAYSASKAGLLMMTRSLATDLAPSVRVNAVSPGAILWPEEKAEMSDTAKEAYLDRVPLGRLGSVEEIAGTVLFLADNKYMTGQVIHVDGGRHMM